MFEYQPIEIDAKDVQSKLEGTTLNFWTISKKLMNAVNKPLIKQAKANFRSNFNPKNHSLKYTQNGNIKPTLSSFRYENSKNEKMVSYVKNRAYSAAFGEAGADITPKNGKYLIFKVNGEFKRVEHVVLQPKPFIKPAVDEFWGTARASEIMDKKLNQILKDYWEKNKPPKETQQDRTPQSD